MRTEKNHITAQNVSIEISQKTCAELEEICFCEQKDADEMLKEMISSFREKK